MVSDRITPAAGAAGQVPVGSPPDDPGSLEGPGSASDPADRSADTLSESAVRAATEPVPEPTIGLAVADPVFTARNLSVHYGSKLAVDSVNLDIPRRQITAIIGPSGCGKSTFIRCLNRMNDLVPTARVSGELKFGDHDLYARDVDPVEVRRRIGMVFQKPNPFPQSIYDNVAFGPKIAGTRKGLDDIVERSLRNAALWDEVKNDLKKSAFALSGGQQQRLCIARALAVEPEVLLMDEPCSALDPIATAKIEDLMGELAQSLTIVIVTHNMQQAARVSEATAFFTAHVGEEDERFGMLVEYDETKRIFTNPSDKRTEDYITGRFG